MKVALKQFHAAVLTGVVAVASPAVLAAATDQASAVKPLMLAAKGNPCAAKNPCNPCAAKHKAEEKAMHKAGNPCAAKHKDKKKAMRNPCNPCNPCAAKKTAMRNPCNPCNPCAAKKKAMRNPCNPCAAKK